MPSPYWGNERIWDTRVNNHNSMFGRDGRLWLAASVRGTDNPAFCKAGSTHPSAQGVPDGARGPAPVGPRSEDDEVQLRRHLLLGTHHLQFGYDANDTLWTSGGGPVVGWLNTKMFDETGDAAASQGWTALVLDTNGNGKRDDYVEPDQPVDPDQGQAHQLAGFYAVMPNPADGSIWGATLGDPGRGRARWLRARTRRRPRWPRSTTCRCPASACAAPTSTARAWSGCRWPAATWAASIAASARGR